MRICWRDYDHEPHSHMMSISRANDAVSASSIQPMPDPYRRTTPSPPTTRSSRPQRRGLPAPRHQATRCTMTR